LVLFRLRSGRYSRSGNEVMINLDLAIDRFMIQYEGFSHASVFFDIFPDSKYPLSENPYIPNSVQFDLYQQGVAFADTVRQKVAE
jgi:hypothetical protein